MRFELFVEKLPRASKGRLLPAAIALTCLLASVTASAAFFVAFDLPQQTGAAVRAAEPWSVRLRLVHIVSLGASWLGLLLAAQLLYQRWLNHKMGRETKALEERLQTQVAELRGALEASQTAQAGSPPPAEELTKLQLELAEARDVQSSLRAELAKARMLAQNVERAATIPAVEPVQIPQQLAKLQEDLSMSRAALAALQEQSSNNKALTTGQAAEILRLNLELKELKEQLRAARAVPDPETRASSYSVTSSQEERITPRRRG